MSAPLIVTRPRSGRTKPSRTSITVDLPAPDGPASTSVSPAGTRNDSPSSAGPRVGSQVRRTSSNATVTPRAATVRTSRCGCGAGRRRQIDQRLGRAGGVQPVLVGGGEPAQRGEELRDQQQHEQRRAGVQAAGPQFASAAQGQHHEGERRRQVERGGGQERDAQHPHGAPPQFVGSGGERHRLGLGLAVQHDGGDAADAIEEPRLQPRQGQELVPRRRRRADPGDGHGHRHQQSAQHQHQGGPWIGHQCREGHQQRAGHRQHGRRQPARVQAVQRLDAIHHGRCQLAAVPGTELRRTRIQQARQRVAPQPPPRRCAGVEGGALGADRQRRAEQRQHREARRERQRVAGAAGQGAAKQHRGTPCLADRRQRAGGAEQHDRPGRPAADALLTAQPGLRCCLGLPRSHSGRPLSPDDMGWTGWTA